MKVAIFSDVQANLPALEVAADQILNWRADLVIMAGDLVNRGPNSRECVNLFEQLRRDYGWLPIKGNHETWVMRCVRESPRTALEGQLRRFADWTAQQLGSLLTLLADWPDHLCFHGEHSGWVHVTHGTMLSNRRGISVNVSDDELRAGALPPDIDLFVTAHTHRPLQRLLDGTPILNVGSVGSPFDGDPRGSYALLEESSTGWHTRIVRFDYDRARAESDFRTSGFIEEGGPLARILFEEWRQARLLMPLWRQHYEAQVLAGERLPEPAVTDFLATFGNL